MNKSLLFVGGQGLVIYGIGQIMDGHWLAISTIILGIWIAIWGITNKRIRWFIF